MDLVNTLLTLSFTAAGIIFGFLVFRVPGLLWGGLTGLLVGLVINLQKRLSVLEKSHQALLSKLADPNTPPRDFSTQAPSSQGVHQYLKPATPLGSEPNNGEAFGPPPLSAVDGEEASEALSFTFEAASDTVAAIPPNLPQPTETTSKYSSIAHRIGRFLTAANIVVGVGLIVLFFGVAFLLKFAIDRNLISLEMRYTGVCLLGGALLVAGWFFRKRRRDFALLIQGGAVGILYITVFSAARWHELIPITPAFFIMVGLGVLSGALAVGQNARGLAVLAAVGGFAAPVLTSSGRPQHIIIFSYYALLGVGIFGVAFFKSWRELNLIGFGFTLVIGCLWGWRYYQPTLFPSAEFFLILFFLLYLTISVLYAIRQPPKLKGLVDGPLVFGLPMAAFALQAGLMEHPPFGLLPFVSGHHLLAVSALVLGGIYFILAAVLRRISFPYSGRLVDAFLGLGVLFISLAVPLAFNARWTAVSWGLEGAALVWIGIRQNRIAARRFGLLLVFISGLAALPGIFDRRSGPPILNGWFTAYFTVTLGALFASFQLTRHRRDKGRPAAFFLAYGLVWWYAGGLLEIDEYVPRAYQYNAMIAFLAASGLIWSALYRRLSWTKLKFILFCLSPVLVVMVLAQFPGILYMHPFQKYGYLAWLPAFLAQYLILWRHESDLTPVSRSFQHIAALGLPIFILSREMVWGLDDLSRGLGCWRFLGWGLGPGLAAAVLTLWADRLPWPVRNNRQTYLGIGLPLLLASNLVWLVLGGITNPGNARPFGYLVLLNPLEMTQALVMSLPWVWYLFLKKGRLPCPGPIKPEPIPYLLGGVTFLLINAIPARAIHHWRLVPWRFYDLWSNMVFQTAISIFWSVLSLSLMAAANRKGRRGPWFAGASLLAAVVIKLFLVDLSQTGTITRIISFLAVGLLMLLIGYLSPLPPRRQTALE